MKKNIRQNKGITLIALVITIIVLLILAGVGISMLTGDKSILENSEDAKEKTIISRIKERAELVKMGLHIDFWTSTNKPERIQKNSLIYALGEEFDNSTVGGSFITTNDGYDILVDDELNITVQKHVYSSGISLLYDKFTENDNVIIEVYVIDENIPSYEEFAEGIFNSLPTNPEERNVKLGELLVEGYNYYESENKSLEEILELAGVSSIEELGGEEFLIANGLIKPEKYLENGRNIIVSCSNGENKTTNIFEGLVYFTITENGTYTISAEGTTETVAVTEVYAENPTIVQVSELKAGDRVSYQANGIEDPVECFVLWDNTSEYGRDGVQIITADIVENVTLGSNDRNEATESYNNAIDILNNRARAYMNEELSIGARCVGSVPNNPNSQSEIDSTIGLRRPDENYNIDYQQLINLKILSTGTKENSVTGHNYWLASRTDDDDWNMNDVYVGLYSVMRGEFSSRLYRIKDDSYYRRYNILQYNRNYSTFVMSNARTLGLRPVFILKNDEEIIRKVQFNGTGPDNQVALED